MIYRVGQSVGVPTVAAERVDSAWLVMLPVVLVAAPVIRRVTHAVTREQ